MNNSAFPLPNRIATRQSSRTISAIQDSTPIQNLLSRGFEDLLNFSDVEERLQKTTQQFNKGKIFFLLLYLILDLHYQRLEFVKKILQDTRKDNWKYLSIDSLV